MLASKLDGKKIPLYDATQKQREMERRIRATKRELAGLDEGIKVAETDELRNALRADFNGASVRLKKQEAALKEFLRKNRASKRFHSHPDARLLAVVRRKSLYMR